MEYESNLSVNFTADIGRVLISVRATQITWKGFHDCTIHVKLIMLKKRNIIHGRAEIRHLKVTDILNIMNPISEKNI